MKNKTADLVKDLAVEDRKFDDSIYRLDKVMQYIKETFDAYLSESVAQTAKDRQKEEERKSKLRETLQVCYSGLEKDREFVKQYIKRMLTGAISMKLENWPADYKIDPTNYCKVLDFNKPALLPPHVQYLLLIYYFKPQHGDRTFKHLINKYGLAKFREMPVLQGDFKTDLGSYISSEDISAIFANEHITVTYELAIEVLTQLVYEEYRGNSCIDELMYQSIDDIGIGLSGLQNDVVPIHLLNKQITKAYEGVWIKNEGVLMCLKFLSFGSFENLTRVVRNLVAYNQSGSFSEADGFKLGSGSDGSRRTSVIYPFGENSAAWIRKFTVKSLTNRDLVMFNNPDLKGAADLIRTERALIRGGATIPICGPQGAGKTTCLESLSEYIQNWYAIRMIESEFEARLKWRYPEKNIFTVQTTQISPETAYEFSLRSSGDIYIVSEVRSDEMTVNITRTANRGGRSVLFTYHPNKPRACIIEIANSLVRQKLYSNLKDAMYTTLDAIKCCIHIDVDLEERRRYYNIYEFIPTYVFLDDSYKKLQGEKREQAFQDSLYSYFQKTTSDEYFTVVPIITYDHAVGGYKFQNTVSDGFYDDLLRKSSIDSEKTELEKLFRPKNFIYRYMKGHGMKTISEQEFFDLVRDENINRAFISYDDVKGLNLG